MGSIREALKAGCRLASTETKMTIAEIIKTSIGAIVGRRTSPFCRPKSKVTTPEKFRI
jgi:hypothetical protein